MIKLNINMTELISSKLDLESYFILYCLYHKNENLLRKYTLNCRKIDTEIFNQLEKNELINIGKNDGKLYYGLLSLTDKGSHWVESVCKDPSKTTKSLKSDGNLNATNEGWKSFRQCYPNVVRFGATERRLHVDLDRCEKLYNKLLLETTHDILCKTAKAYHNEHIQRNGEIYMKALSTWLNQKIYLTYIDKINETNEEITNLDAI